MARELKYLEKCFNFIAKIFWILSDLHYFFWRKLDRMAVDVISVRDKICRKR